MGTLRESQSERGKLFYLIVSMIFLVLVGVAATLPIGHSEGQEAGGTKPGKIVIPAMARKAGGRLRPELMKVANAHDKSSQEVEGDDYDLETWSDEGSSEEPDCSRGMYFHIRGRHCVPLRCNGGNKWRDQATGDCMCYPPEICDYRPRYTYIRQGYGQGLVSPQSHNRLSPAVYRTTQYQRHTYRWRVWRG